MIMPPPDHSFNWEPVGWFAVGYLVFMMVGVIINTIFGGGDETRD